MAPRENLLSIERLFKEGYILVSCSWICVSGFYNFLYIFQMPKLKTPLVKIKIKAGVKVMPILVSMLLIQIAARTFSPFGAKMRKTIVFLIRFVHFWNVLFPCLISKYSGWTSFWGITWPETSNSLEPQLTSIWVNSSDFSNFVNGKFSYI